MPIENTGMVILIIRQGFMIFLRVKQYLFFKIRTIRTIR